MYCRVTLNKNSNDDMFDNFYYYEERYSEIILRKVSTVEPIYRISCCIP